MELCLICGQEYDPVSDAQHEYDCQDRMVEDIRIEIKADKELKRILENLLNEKNKR
jgi:hypothetical protein